MFKTLDDWLKNNWLFLCATATVHTTFSSSGKNKTLQWGDQDEKHPDVASVSASQQWNSQTLCVSWWDAMWSAQHHLWRFLINKVGFESNLDFRSYLEYIGNKGIKEQIIQQHEDAVGEIYETKLSTELAWSICQIYVM